MIKKNLDMLLYISAIMLAIGVFLPLTTFAIIGDVSYNRIAQLESYIVILLAVSAPIFIFIKQSRFIIASVIGVWVTLLLPAIQNLMGSTDSSMLGQLSNKASAAMQDFAAEFFFNVFEFSWGGYVFLLGLILFTATGLMKGLTK